MSYVDPMARARHASTVWSTTSAVGDCRAEGAVVTQIADVLDEQDFIGRRGRVALLGAVHESLPMLQVLLADPRVVLMAVLTSGTGTTLAGAIDLGALAEQHDVPVYRGLDLRSPDSLCLLRKLDLDLLIVVGWTRLVPAEVLALPRFGCVGFHASLLPRHRGRAPVNWAIINGETQTGATMLMLDPGVDTGPIVDQLPIAISDDDTCGTVYERVAVAGVALLLKHLPALLEGCAPMWRQLPDDGDVLPRRTPDMGITDWDRSARDVYNWIRGLTHPYPGAFSMMRGEAIRLWRAQPLARVPNARAAVVPGTIIGCDADGVLVAACDGVVRLLSVGFGDRELPALQWFRDQALEVGDAFDAVDPAIAAWARGFGPVPAEGPR